MKRAKKNPLSYLGWLGLIGIIGIYYMAPWMITFLLFFFFFTYSKMVPDELFWNNVRRAATKAFAVNIGSQTLIFLFLFFRAVSGKGILFSEAVQASGEACLVDVNYLFSTMIQTSMNVIIFIVTLCTFFFCLMRYNRQEKKFVEEDESC